MSSDVGRPHELSSPQSGCFTLIVCPKPNYFPAWSKVCFAPWPVGCCKCLSHIHSGQHDLNQIGKTTVQNSLRFNKKATMLFDMLNLRFPRWTLLLSNYLPITILLNCQILREISRTLWRFLGSSGVFHPGWPGWPTFPPKIHRSKVNWRAAKLAKGAPKCAPRGAKKQVLEVFQKKVTREVSGTKWFVITCRLLNDTRNI